MNLKDGMTVRLVATAAGLDFDDLVTRDTVAVRQIGVDDLSSRVRIGWAP